MRISVSLVTLACAALVAACGGGGSSSGSNNGSSGGSSSATAVSMSGVASKGLMANATVTAHAVKSDGTVDDTPLATTTTDSTGHYSLSFAAVKDQPYVIRVRATANTTHLDEVTGAAQPLPEGFTMRALYVPTSTGNVTTTASVTPFSEMAAAAAAKATGGFTADNVQQATSTITQLLGFNPVSVQAKPAAEASSAEEQKLAVMLAAVSKLASDGALGCGTASSGGAQTQCVVEKLAGASSKDSIKLETSSGSSTTDVSAALQTALGDVLADNHLTGNIPSSTLVSVLANLSCSGDSCHAATGTGTTSPSPTATAIAATKAMLLQLKSDWLSLFAGSPSSVSATEMQATLVGNAMRDIQVPGDVLVRDLGVLVAAVDLLHSAKTDPSWTQMNIGLSSGLTQTYSGPTLTADYPPIRCNLVSETTNNTPATTAAQAVAVSCRVSYNRAYNVTNSTVTEYIHGFTVTRNNDGTYHYGTRARERTVSTLTPSATPTLVDRSGAFSGTVSPTFDGAGKISAFAMTGTLAPAWSNFAIGQLVNHHHTWSLNGSITDAVTGSFSATGSIASYADASTVAGTLALDQGDVTMGTVGGNKALTAADLSLSWTTAGAGFVGTFKLSGPVMPAVGTQYAYAHAELGGVLSTLTNGVASQFISAKLVASVSGYDTFDSTAAPSSTNTFSAGVALTATVTAPSRPKLEFTLGTSGHAHDTQLNTATLQYRSFAAGSTTPTRVIAVTVNRTNTNEAAVSISEAVSGVSIGWTGNPTTATVMYGDTQIGTVDRATKMLTFVDNSFQSIDLGL